VILLEPPDLDDLDSARAVDRVAADLRAHRATPDGGYRFGDQLRAVTEAMSGAETYDTAAALTDQVAGDIHGLLPTLTRFLQAAGQQALASGTETARRLAADFEEAAGTVTGIAMRLADAGGHLRRLGPTAPAQQAADVTADVAQPPSALGRPRTR
jgi:hypothetical protein